MKISVDGERWVPSFDRAIAWFLDRRSWGRVLLVMIGLGWGLPGPALLNGPALCAQENANALEVKAVGPSLVLANRHARAVRLRVVANKAGEAKDVDLSSVPAQWQGTLRPGAVQVVPEFVNGVVMVELDGQLEAHQVQGNRAYVLLPTKERTRLEVRELSFGDVPKTDLTKPPSLVRTPAAALAAGRVPVLLCFDAREPEKQKLWEARLRARLTQASTHFQAVTGLKLEVVEVRSWTPTRVTNDLNEGLREFRQSLELGEALVAIGFSRQYDMLPADFPLKVTPPSLLASHLLIPEARVGISSEQCLAMLLHELGRSWGGVHVPESSSPLRPNLEEPARPWPLAYDPANALIMSIVAGEVRTRGIRELNELTSSNRDYVNGIRTRLTAATNQALQDLLAADRENMNPLPGPAPLPGQAPLVPRPALPAVAALRPGQLNYDPLPAGTQFTVTEVKLPDVPGGDAIWTGTTLDRQGRAWLAVSSSNSEHSSAHVMFYDPESRAVRSLGGVAEWLKKTQRFREGELAGFIVTPLVAGSDGHIYFASLGEDLPQMNVSRRPPWGSRIWRIDGGTGEWEHLTVVPDGIVSLAVRGDRLFALGYPGHMVYQFDLKSGDLRKQEIGSTANHCCRNLVVDSRGHVFVPRVQNLAARSVDLMELNESLEPLTTTMIEYFANGSAPELSGIMATWDGGDGTTAFLTAAGSIYRIGERLSSTEPAPVEFVSRSASQAATTLLAAAAHPSSGQLLIAQQAAGSPAERLQIVQTGTAQNNRRGSAFPGLGEFPGLSFQGAASWTADGEILFGGTYPRGTLELAPTLIESLRQRGWTAEQLDRLRENARRKSQPVLFMIRPPQRAGE